VDYTGSTRRPGVFKKTIALKTNAKVSTDYLYIMGEMVEKVVEDRLKQQTVN
jgi:nucleoside-triphosphatase THEP1